MGIVLRFVIGTLWALSGNPNIRECVLIATGARKLTLVFCRSTNTIPNHGGQTGKNCDGHHIEHCEFCAWSVHPRVVANATFDARTTSRDRIGHRK